MRLVLLVVVLPMCLMVMRGFLPCIMTVAVRVAVVVGWFSYLTSDVVRPRTTDKQGFEGVQPPLFI